MVALSLYRGNMHRVPDVPRRWLMPDQNIPFKSFKALHNRRLKALSRLQSETATTSNPNPNSTDPVIKNAEGAPDHEGEKSKEKSVGEAKDCGVKETGGGETVGGSGSLTGPEAVVVDKESVQVPLHEEPHEVEADKAVENVEPNSEVQELSDKEKRRKEAEEKLQALNTKKHGLVQLLKQVDVQNDPDPTCRHATPRTGSEPNHGTEMEGAEAYDASNHMAHPRPFHRMSSMSPSSESPHKRFGYFQHNTVPHPSRATFGAASPSPSRFAPTPPQGHPASFPPTSVCTTNYVGSLPSPAASGGTPIFRDTRHPSPWS
uniref:Uncharacterized protein n=1 Tax=Kalanchoe fedtschenkoi TaxID=63787 RepID=A0A7N0V1U7_KALFE